MTVLALVAAISAVAEPTLYRIEVKGRFGFIDRGGSVVVPPTLRSAGRMREGLAWFSRDGKRYGYLGVSGKPAIPARFTFAADFSEGLAAASEKPVKDGFATYGFIGRDGKFRIPQKFDASEPDPGDGLPPLGYVHERPEGSGGIEAAWFERGRAELGSGRWIGRDGRPASAPAAPFGQVPGTGPAREGLRSFLAPSQYPGVQMLSYDRFPSTEVAFERVIYTRRETGRAADPVLNFFSEGRAPVWGFYRGGVLRYGYIDARGEEAVLDLYDEIRPFRGGLAEVVRLGRTQYVDRAGKRVWPK